MLVSEVYSVLDLVPGCSYIFVRNIFGDEYSLVFNGDETSFLQQYGFYKIVSIGSYRDFLSIDIIAY